MNANNGQQFQGNPNQSPYPPAQQYEPLMQAAVRKNMIGYFQDRKKTIIAIWLAVIIGAAFSFLIVEYRLRLNVFMFYTILLAATGYLMHLDDNLALKPFVFFSVCFLAIASVFMRLAFTGYLVIAGLLLPVIYVLMTVFASKQKYRSDIIAILFRGVCSIGFIHQIIVALASLKRKNDEKKKQALHILIGIGITTVLLIILVPIMLSADEMFSIKLANIFGNISIGMFILKVILAAVVAMAIFGFFYVITAHRLKEKKDSVKKELPSVTTIILTITIMLAALFTFFAIVQFSYLFVGAASDLPEGFSYSQYARSGYFQLVVLSGLNFGIILACVFFSKKGSTPARKAIKGILAYFNALNIYLLVSAAYKMRLYQNEFGLTSSRLLVYILLSFEAVLIIGLMVKIFKQEMNFVKLAIYFSVAFFAATSFINVEAISLKSNMNNFYESGEFDFADITFQSADSSRVVYGFFIENHEDFTEAELDSMYIYFRSCYNGVRARSMDNYIEDYTDRNWREYNISENSAYKHSLQFLKEYNR